MEGRAMIANTRATRFRAPHRVVVSLKTPRERAAAPGWRELRVEIRHFIGGASILPDFRAADVGVAASPVFRATILDNPPPDRSKFRGCAVTRCNKDGPELDPRFPVQSQPVFDIVDLAVERRGMADEYDPYDEQDGPGVPDGLPCVELEFATLRRFREEMAPYLNYDGFFARTDRPLPRGTSVEFKFVMPEDFILAHGTAVVSWIIEPENNPELVPGMALRFGQVGKQSRAVIDELVDFHIATGGDPFNVGPRASWAGEIPTDALVGTGGGALSIIDSPAPMTRELPLPPDPEEPRAPEVPEVPEVPEIPEDDVLPDWLSGSVGATPATRFEMPSEPKEPVPDAGTSEGFDFSSSLSSDQFDVDMIFENGEKDPTPLRRDDESYRQMAMAPRADNKPPRDIRLGLIVTAGLVVVAMGVLGLTYWLRNSDREVVEAIPQENTVVEVGVELIDDDADLVIEDELLERLARLEIEHAGAGDIVDSRDDGDYSAHRRFHSGLVVDRLRVAQSHVGLDRDIEVFADLGVGAVYHHRLYRAHRGRSLAHVEASRRAAVNDR